MNKLAKQMIERVLDQSIHEDDSYREKMGQELKQEIDNLSQLWKEYHTTKPEAFSRVGIQQKIDVLIAKLKAYPLFK